MGSSSGRLSSWTCDAMRARQGRLDEAGRSRRVRVCFRVVYLFVWWCAKSAYVGCCVWFGWQVNERCITAQRGILAWNRSFFTLGEKGREANAEMKKNRNLVGFLCSNKLWKYYFISCLFVSGDYQGAEGERCVLRLLSASRLPRAGFVFVVIFKQNFNDPTEKKMKILNLNKQI